MLETAPSFSIYSNSNIRVNDNESKNEVEKSGDDFSFVGKSIDLIKEDDEEIQISEHVDVDQPNNNNNNDNNSSSMYLATGFGLQNDDDDDGGGVDLEEILKGDISEDYCIHLLDEHPNHRLLLIKYAELLQRKGDLQGAEEYYYRAAQADPRDAEILVRYAQLVWELNHDHGTALTYFDLAAQTAPDNSNVMAAYAKFLWETEDGNDENGEAHLDTIQANNQEKYLHVNPADVRDTDDVESYKQMIDENPSHPIFLKKYAQFLYQSKGDLHGAERYYSRAIWVERRDSETLSQFATLIWELYHDHNRALKYLEQALEASPQDSNVLAAYARILWTIDDE